MEVARAVLRRAREAVGGDDPGRRAGAAGGADRALVAVEGVGDLGAVGGDRDVDGRAVHRVRDRVHQHRRVEPVEHLAVLLHAQDLVAVADGDRAVVGLRGGAVGVLGGAVRGHLVLAAAVAGGEPDVAALDVDDRVGGRHGRGERERRRRAPGGHEAAAAAREGGERVHGAGLCRPGHHPAFRLTPRARVRRDRVCLSCRADGPRLDRPLPHRRTACPRRRGRGDARAAPRLLPPPAREHAQDARGARRRGAGDAVRGRPRRGDLGAPRGGADLRRRRRAHDRAGRRAARARGGGGRPRRRRAADRAAGGAARPARPHGRRHDRHPARADRDPRRRRQRHRQDDHDRQARLAPARTRSARPW